MVVPSISAQISSERMPDLESRCNTLQGENRSGEKHLYALFKHLGFYDLIDNFYFAGHRKVLETLKLMIDNITGFLDCALLPRHQRHQ